MLAIDELYELAAGRRTIRGFKKYRNVPEDCISKILDIARWAPSGGNGQPWEFIVIRDAEKREWIAELFRKQQVPKLEMEKAVRGQATPSGAGFRNAPVYILVLGDPRVKDSYPVRTREEKAFQHLITGLASAGLLIQLAAASLGLGSQYVSDASSPYMATMLKTYLGIPDHMRVYELIPIGYPAKAVPVPPRRSLDEIVHHETYDMKKARTDDDVRNFLLTMTRVGGYGRKGKRPEHI
jgi:5,6-dimethylbenzimidazole synthase